jgi:predicted ribosomally synthesized peptide with nif11-like leader
VLDEGSTLSTRFEEGCMSTKAATEFLEKVANDEVLQAKFTTPGGDPKQRLATMVETGRQHGFQFTADEVRDVLKAKRGEGALDERQLAAVAGGAAWYAKAWAWLETNFGGSGGDDGGGNAGGGIRG